MSDPSELQDELDKLHNPDAGELQNELGQIPLLQEVANAPPTFVDSMAAYIRSGANERPQDFLFLIYQVVDEQVQVSEDGEYFFESENLYSRLSTYYHIHSLVGRQIEVTNITFVGIDHENSAIDLLFDDALLLELPAMLPLHPLSNVLGHASVVAAYTHFFAVHGNHDAIFGLSGEESQDSHSPSKTSENHQIEQQIMLGKRDFNNDIKADDTLEAHSLDLASNQKCLSSMMSGKGPLMSGCVDAQTNLDDGNMNRENTDSMNMEENPAAPDLSASQLLIESTSAEARQPDGLLLEPIEGLRQIIQPIQDAQPQATTHEAERNAIGCDTPDRRSAFIDGLPGELNVPETLESHLLKLKLEVAHLIKSRAKIRSQKDVYEIDTRSPLNEKPSFHTVRIEPCTAEKSEEQHLVTNLNHPHVEINQPSAEILPTSINFQTGPMPSLLNSRIKNSIASGMEFYHFASEGSNSKTSGLQKIVEEEKDIAEQPYRPDNSDKISEEKEDHKTSNNKRKPINPTSLQDHINSSIAEPENKLIEIEIELGGSSDSITENTGDNNNVDVVSPDPEALLPVPDENLPNDIPRITSPKSPPVIELTHPESAVSELLHQSSTPTLETMAVLAILTRETKMLVNELDQKNPKKADIYHSVKPSFLLEKLDLATEKRKSASSSKLMDLTNDIVEMPIIELEVQESQVIKDVNSSYSSVRKMMITEFSNSKNKIQDLGLKLLTQAQSAHKRVADQKNSTLIVSELTESHARTQQAVSQPSSSVKKRPGSSFEHNPGFSFKPKSTSKGKKTPETIDIELESESIHETAALSWNVQQKPTTSHELIVPSKESIPGNNSNQKQISLEEIRSSASRMDKGSYSASTERRPYRAEYHHHDKALQEVVDSVALGLGFHHSASPSPLKESSDIYPERSLNKPPSIRSSHQEQGTKLLQRIEASNEGHQGIARPGNLDNAEHSIIDLADDDSQLQIVEKHISKPQPPIPVPLVLPAFHNHGLTLASTATIQYTPPPRIVVDQSLNQMQPSSRELCHKETSTSPNLLAMFVGDLAASLLEQDSSARPRLVFESLEDVREFEDDGGQQLSNDKRKSFTRLETFSPSTFASPSILQKNVINKRKIFKPNRPTFNKRYSQRASDLQSSGKRIAGSSQNSEHATESKHIQTENLNTGFEEILEVEEPEMIGHEKIANELEKATETNYLAAPGTFGKASGSKDTSKKKNAPVAHEAFKSIISDSSDDEKAEYKDSVAQLLAEKQKTHSMNSQTKELVKNPITEIIEELKKSSQQPRKVAKSRIQVVYDITSEFTQAAMVTNVDESHTLKISDNEAEDSSPRKPQRRATQVIDQQVMAALRYLAKEYRTAGRGTSGVNSAGAFLKEDQVEIEKALQFLVNSR